MKIELRVQPAAVGANVKTNATAWFSRTGFTMIELLTVITVIMILAALVLGAAAYVSRKADEGRCQARMQTIKNALEEYKLDYGKYPQGTETTITGETTYNTLFKVLFSKPIVPPPTGGRPSGETRPYLSDTNFLNSSLQLVDPWGNYFRYKAPGTHNKTMYDLWPFGPNSVDDSGNATTSDDINNWSSGH